MRTRFFNSLYILSFLLSGSCALSKKSTNSPEGTAPKNPLPEKISYDLPDTEENKFYFQMKHVFENDLAHMQQIIETRHKKKSVSKPSILIVGAGPTGLMTAIESYLYGAEKITVLEARTAYIRNTPVRIDGPLDSNSKPPAGFVDLISALKTILGDKTFAYLEEQKILLKSGLNHPPITRSIKIKEFEMVLASFLKVLQEKDPQHDLAVLYGAKFERKDQTDKERVLTVKAKGKNGQEDTLQIEAALLVSAEGGRTEAGSYINDREPLTFSATPSYAMVSIYENSPKIIPLDSWTDPAKNKQYQETSSPTDPTYAHVFSTLQTEFAWDPTETLGLAGTQLPRTRLFVLKDVLYYGMELTKHQYTHFANDRDALLKMAQTRAEPSLHGTAAQLAPLRGKLDVAAMPIELKKKKHSYYAMGNKNMIGFLLGDSLAQTHFFTGSGLNRGLEDAVHMGELFDSWDSSKVNHFAKPATDPLLKNLENAQNLSIGRMFLKCNGAAAMPPDGVAQKGFMQMKKPLFERHFSNILPTLKAAAPNYTTANWAK